MIFIFFPKVKIFCKFLIAYIYIFFQIQEWKMGMKEKCQCPLSHSFSLLFFKWEVLSETLVIFFCIFQDCDMFWDFISLRPETTHQVSFLFSDRGTPDGYRHMNGYGSHTFKLVNEKGEAVYCKFHYKTDQGIK